MRKGECSGSFQMPLAFTRGLFQLMTTVVCKRVVQLYEALGRAHDAAVRTRGLATRRDDVEVFEPRRDYSQAKGGLCLARSRGRAYPGLPFASRRWTGEFQRVVDGSVLQREQVKQVVLV